MFYSRKSKTAAAPAPVVAPVAINGEPDIRGLGRVLWQKKTTKSWASRSIGGRRLHRRQCDHAALPSESRLLLEVRDNVFMRAEADKGVSDRTANIDPEAVTSQIQVVLSRDLAQAVIKKEKLDDNPNSIRWRRPVGGLDLARSVRHRPRSRVR